MSFFQPNSNNLPTPKYVNNNTVIAEKKVARKRTVPAAENNSAVESLTFGKALEEIGQAISAFGTRISQIALKYQNAENNNNVNVSPPVLLLNTTNAETTKTISKNNAAANEETTKKGKKKDANAPKKPPSGYLLFCAEKRPGLTNAEPDLKSVDIIKRLAEMWDAEPDKPHYLEQAKQLSKEYEVAKNNYAASTSASSSTNNLGLGSSSSIGQDGKDEASSKALNTPLAPGLTAPLPLSTSSDRIITVVAKKEHNSNDSIPSSQLTQQPTIATSAAASAKTSNESIALSQESSTSSKKKKKKHHHKDSSDKDQNELL